MTSFEDRRADWQAKVIAQKASGLTIASWCLARGISTHTFSYWRAKFSEASVETSQWASVAPEAAAETLCVRVGSATMEVSAGFDASLLTAIVSALSQC